MDKFRQELLRTDIVPRQLNEVSQKYKELFLKDLESGKIEIEVVTECQCGSSKLEQLTNIDRFGLPFGSLICQDCGLIITSPRIKEESLPYYYDKYYHPLNYGKEHLENQTALFADGQGKKIFNILKEHLPKREKIKVLEIGSGTGNILSEFKEEAKKESISVEELGTEYNQDCIDLAKSREINIIYGNIDTVVKKEEKFDVIILSHVFEHFIDLQKEMNSLKQLMHSETLLYIEVPGVMKSHEKDYYDFSFLGYLVHAHMYNFTKATLVNTVVHYGFKNIYSNEEVESVFKLTDKTEENTQSANSYNEIMEYLEKYYLAYSFLKEAVELKLIKLNKQLEKYETMIENRNKDITKLSEQVENRNVKLEKYETMIENRNKDITKLSEQVENRNVKLEKYINLTKQLEDEKLLFSIGYKKDICEKIIRLSHER